MSPIRASGSAVLARNKLYLFGRGYGGDTINDGETLEQWKNTLGLSEVPLKTPEQFGQTVKSDIRDWGAIVRAGNIKAD